MKQIKTNSHTLIVVPVPEDAERFSLEFNTLRCSNKNGFYEIDVLPGCWTEKQQLKSLEVIAKVLGYVTPSEISFDAEPYVEYRQDREFYKDYLFYNKTLHLHGQGGQTTQWNKKTASDSFRSLLAANGVMFENPHGKNKPFETAKPSNDPFLNYGYVKQQEEINKWSDAQNNVIKKCVILLKKN